MIGTIAAPSAINAMEVPFECSAANGAKVIKIYQSTMAFSNGYERGRAIASALPTRTQKTISGFTKFTNFEGLNYKLHIENIDSLSDVDDYLTIKNQNGHEMTYPITCKKL